MVRVEAGWGLVMRCTACGGQGLGGRWLCSWVVRGRLGWARAHEGHAALVMDSGAREKSTQCSACNAVLWGLHSYLRLCLYACPQLVQAAHRCMRGRGCSFGARLAVIGEIRLPELRLTKTQHFKEHPRGPNSATPIPGSHEIRKSNTETARSALAPNTQVCWSRALLTCVYLSRICLGTTEH